MSTPEPEGPVNTNPPFSVQLTTYSTAPSKSGKAPGKVTKTVKTKELLHTLDVEEHTQFLEALLQKHGESKYHVTERRPFSFRFYCPPLRAKTDTIDIDNNAEYREMVTAIQEYEKTGKKALKVVTILVDMNDVKKACRIRSDEEPSEDDTDDNLGSTTGNLTRSEEHLANIRMKLEKKHKNDDDNGYSYAYADGFRLQLTPFLMKEWAIAVFEGKATIHHPPNTQAFDPDSHGISLRPFQSRTTRSPPGMAPTPVTSELGHFSQIIGDVLNFVSNRSTSTPSVPSSSSTTPQTPTRPRHVATSENSPPFHHTPSDITRYLTYAKENLGVPQALVYDTFLRAQDFGPDILHEVDKDDLLALGMRGGEVIRLQRGSQKWWKLNAKRKRSVSDVGEKSVSSESVPQHSYEVSFPEGGAVRYSGPAPMPGDPSEVDSRTKIFDQAKGMMVSLPQGLCAPRYNAPDDDPFAN